MRLGETGIEGDRPLEALLRVEDRGASAEELRAALQEQLVRLEIAGHLGDQTFVGTERQRDLQAIGHRACDLVLDVENILQLAIVAVRPELKAVPDVHQLHGHANAIPGTADATLKNGGDAELLGDVTQIAAAIAERER